MVVAVGTRRDGLAVEVPGDVHGICGIVHPEGDGRIRGEGTARAAPDILQVDVRIAACLLVGFGGEGSVAVHRSGDVPLPAQQLDLVGRRGFEPVDDG